MGKLGKYFGSDFHNELLNNSIHEFQFYTEMITKRAELALRAYFDSVWIKKMEKESVMYRDSGSSLLKAIIKRGGVLGVATEAHEKWETTHHLTVFGAAIKDIRCGAIYKKNNLKDCYAAHASAKYKENLLYQFCYQKSYNTNPPPIKAFISVWPYIDMLMDFDWNKHVSQSIEGQINYLGKYTEDVKDGICSEDDLRSAMKFFEDDAYVYKYPKKILEMAKLYLRNEKQGAN